MEAVVTALKLRKGKSLRLRQRARQILCAMAGAILFVASYSAALAQCAMCRAAVGNSAEAAKASSGMNLAVLVLLVPPVALFCAFFVAAYRFRKAPGEEPLAADNIGEKLMRPSNRRAPSA